MRPLRIVTVLPSIDWRFGGSIGQARVIAREFARRGHEVAILTTDQGRPDDAGHGWREHDGYQLFVAPAGPLHRSPPYPAPRTLVTELDRLLDRTDVVTSQVGLTLLNVTTSRRCRRRAVPFVYSAQGALAPRRLRQRWLQKKLFLAVFERPLLRRASALQALTEQESIDLRRQGAPADRITTVPNGIDLDAWPPGDGVRARAAWGIPDSATILLYLGRLAPEKDLDLALTAAAPVLRERADARFVIAGPDHGSAEELARRIAHLHLTEQVLLAGPVRPGERRHALAAADVFAHTSHSEGLPLSVLEAATAGLPLWITDGCNVPEVTEYDAGIVAPSDAGVLTTSLRDLLADRSWQTRAGRNARRMVEERFALQHVVDRLESLYRELATTSARRSV